MFFQCSEIKVIGNEQQLGLFSLTNSNWCLQSIYKTGLLSVGSVNGQLRVVDVFTHYSHLR